MIIKLPDHFEWCKLLRNIYIIYIIGGFYEKV